MAEVDTSIETGTGVHELDETRSYTIVATAASTDIAGDGGTAVGLPNGVSIVVGPGVGKIQRTGGAASLFPRSDSRM